MISFLIDQSTCEKIFDELKAYSFFYMIKKL